MKTLFSFICGLLAGVSFFLFPFKREATPVERALAQIVYQKVEKYQNDLDIEMVLALVKDFAKKHPPYVEEQELYGPILELDEKHAVAESLAAQRKAESYLASLTVNPKVHVVVANRVFFEILEKGNGESISGEEPVRVYFKEYSMDGKLLKDAVKPFAIPLSQTIKGFQLGMAGAKVGERRKIYIHPEYGFGKMGRKSPNKLLIYEVTVVEKL
jgi:peptidylprolyl isomerase